MFGGLSGFSHGKLPLILQKYLFSLWLIVLLMNEIGHQFPKSMS